MSAEFHRLKAQKRHSQELHYAIADLIQLGILPRQNSWENFGRIVKSTWEPHPDPNFLDWAAPARRYRGENDVALLEGLYSRVEVFCKEGYLQEEVLPQLRIKIQSLNCKSD